MPQPTKGGSWSRDPRTGDLTRIEEPADVPAPAPEEPAGAPEQPVTTKKGK